jgi:GntR family transcriptional regulator
MTSIPFRVDLKPGEPVHDQVVFAVQKAVLAGQLRAGDPFPSVRALSQALRINPNTAHRVVQTLVARGVLAVRPGIGTLVADGTEGSRAERHALLDTDVERLAVEACRLGLSLEEVSAALERHWKKVDRR